MEKVTAGIEHTGRLLQETDWTPRRHLVQIKRGLSTTEEKDLLKRWKETSPSKERLVIKPYEWKRFFPETRFRSDEEIYQKIVLRVRDYEAEARSIRKGTPSGKEQLTKQCPYKKYVPTPKTPTPRALSTVPEVKKAYLDEFKHFCFLLKDYAQRLLRGKVKEPPSREVLPPGGYLQGGILTALLVFLE